MSSRLYRIRIQHTRPGSLRYRFGYRLFNLCLEVDDLDRLEGRLRLFSHNRPNLVSFYDRDHGPRDGTPPRIWIGALLAEHGLAYPGGTLRVLCFPRVLGRAFNPLTIWYCHDDQGALRTLVCEVHNTYRGSHCYVLAGEDGQPLDLQAPPRKRKQFHVSPFFPVTGEYRFRFEAPQRSVAATVAYWQDGAPSLIAELHGEARSLTDRSLLAQVLRMPWAGIKVITAIHWQALKLWWRGARFHPQPPIASTPRSS